MSIKKKLLILVFSLIGVIFFYYQLEYKRYFLSDKDEKDFITIWTSSGNDCYLIPGKYYSPIKPSSNYIKTVNHRNYLGFVWNTQDTRNLKISIYHDFELVDLDKGISVYKNKGSMLSEYGIVDKLKGFDKDQFRSSSDSIRSAINFEYVDLNRLYGIKVWKR